MLRWILARRWYLVLEDEEHKLALAHPSSVSPRTKWAELVGEPQPTNRVVSAQGLVKHYGRGLPDLTLDQVHQRLWLAKTLEARTMRSGRHTKPMAARRWRRMRASVEAELERRAQLEG
jgi:hypothetical protein